ncbi:MAG: DNA repair protein [Leptolyngbya sp. SIOISBB]|nr:DNA repair protein [Leptolyngbya sp. SIOISBB]
MGFPIPGDAIEQSLDLNRHLVHNSAATFFMRVGGDMVSEGEVQAGDLLIVDRSRTAQNQSLVVGIFDGQLVVSRVLKAENSLLPGLQDVSVITNPWEIWGVVTHIVRQV